MTREFVRRHLGWTHYNGITLYFIELHESNGKRRRKNKKHSLENYTKN